jgi:hypothetical protein
MEEAKYQGRILGGDYTEALKGRVSACLAAFLELEKTGNPAIPYLAAWHEDEKTIWYEYVSERFVTLLDCDYFEAAEVFREKIVDRRIYKYVEAETGIEKEVITRRELNVVREELREDSEKQGVTEAVYKLALGNNKNIWVKDQAAIETYERDRTCLSLGCLTIVTKEMEAEEERERLVLELQEALSKIKILSGLLPICASCKKIRDDKGYWNQIESYIKHHSEADFTHSICPECSERLYGEFLKGKK